MTLKIARIRTDGGAQPRARISVDTVSEYAAEMKAGSKFPPIVVFYDGTDYWLADGFHRRDAAVAIGSTAIEAEVKQGTQRDAVLFSAGANSTHGMRRTNDDKRRAVLKLLEDEKWSKWSDREIARRCAVGHPLVAELRDSLTGSSASDPARTYTTKHGTPATMHTENIGRREPNPEPPERTTHERPAPVSHVEAKKRAAYAALELFLSSLSGAELNSEIATICEWLRNFKEV